MEGVEGRTEQRQKNCFRGILAGVFCQLLRGVVSLAGRLNARHGSRSRSKSRSKSRSRSTFLLVHYDQINTAGQGSKFFERSSL